MITADTIPVRESVSVWSEAQWFAVLRQAQDERMRARRPRSQSVPTKLVQHPRAPDVGIRDAGAVQYLYAAGMKLPAIRAKIP